MANRCRQLSEVLDNLQNTRSLHNKKNISLCENSAQRAQRDSYYTDSEEEELCWMGCLDPMSEEGHSVKHTAQNTLSKHLDESAAKEVSEKSTQKKELDHGETSKMQNQEPPVAALVSVAADEDSDTSQTALFDTEVSKLLQNACCLLIGCCFRREN